MGVTHDVVGDTPEDRALDTRSATGTDDHEIDPLGHGGVDDCGTRFALPDEE